jgi:hypothetical protein
VPRTRQLLAEQPTSQCLVEVYFVGVQAGRHAVNVAATRESGKRFAARLALSQAACSSADRTLRPPRLSPPARSTSAKRLSRRVAREVTRITGA